MDFKLAKAGTMGVFKIQLKDSVAFMKVERTNYMNEERTVVIVDAAKFLKLWRRCCADTDASLAHGNTLSWRKDSKYKDAEIGFSYGEKNPVPLAEVSCYQEEILRWLLVFLRVGRIPSFWPRLPCVSIGNGMTRTIWLLTNGATEFPVECTPNCASMLHPYAGVQNTKILSVASLLKI